MFGNLDQSALTYLAGYCVFVAIRGSYDRGPRPDSKRHGSLIAERLVMVTTGLGMMLIPLLFVATAILDNASYSPSPVQFPVGLAIMIASLLLFWKSHRDLGANFSRTLEIHSAHQLVIAGVYSHVRHPIYAAIWLFSIAQALLLPNWIAGLSGLIGFLPMYLIRTPVEERMMLDEFGDTYADYARQTGRLVPRFSHSQSERTDK